MKSYTRACMCGHPRTHARALATCLVAVIENCQMYFDVRQTTNAAVPINRAVQVKKHEVPLSYNAASSLCSRRFFPEINRESEEYAAALREMELEYTRKNRAELVW